MIKQALALTFLALLPMTHALSKTPAVGDTLESVLDELGRPKGEITQDEQQLLYYERGEIEVYEGYVVRMDFISEQELRARKKAAEAAARRARLMRAEKQKALLEEGEREKKRVLADPNFPGKPPREQLDFWQTFTRTYPGVPVDEELAEARSRVEKIQAEEAARAEEERLLAEAAMPPKKKLSRNRLKKERRRIDPTKPVVTADFTPDYRPLGGSIADWPY